ncbi:hypothetical protein MTR67_002629 [Solanum verrucosum]|uniref:Integrase catalytic domain-containing protein n=1 Tax=Solanum verrucosum TaxID=315347 RepID=A0AAF0PWJ1_SOLVR|nr:hypothetical protein MTR67_002629 [Solanum verrucosum]
MKKYIVEFLAKCPSCQQVKVEHQKTGGFLQDISIPTWKWEGLHMDFIVCLSCTRRQHDSIWVIVDCITKSDQFIPIKVSYSVKYYAKFYLKEMTDGKAKCTIKNFEDMLRACVIDFKCNWDDYFPLIQFAYKNSYHSSIGMAPFKDLYVKRCRTPIDLFEVGEVTLIGPQLVHEAMEKV